MKITHIETFLVNATWRNWLFLKVHTDRPGLYGVSEATLEGKERTVATALEEMVPSILGKDPLDIESHWQSLYYRENYWVGGAVFNTALAGLEIALWDILGKVTNQPVYRLLGGKCRNRLKTYANGWYFGASTPAEFAEKARETVEKGYRALKFDPFGNADRMIEKELEDAALETVHAVREAVGPAVGLMIEAHGRFNVYTAVRLALALERFDIFWYEEPLPPENIDALAEVKSRINIPVAAGERIFTKWDYRNLLKNRAVDIVQLDVAHTGGLLEAKKVAAIAEAEYIPVAPHEAGGPVHAAYTIHFDFCTPNFAIQEVFLNEVPWAKGIVTGGFELAGGMYVPNDRPGLGVELNVEEMKKYPFKSVNISFFSTSPEDNLMLGKSSAKQE